MIEIPGYNIKREISASPAAIILLAEQASLDREVALKVLAPELVADKAQVERFRQIARALASFSHPNIVAVYDVGTGPGETPYFSMQYLSGGDFLTRAQRGMSEPDVTETLASIARAVGYVHQRGLIHRAITPQNVLYDAYNTPVLIDFGIAPTASQESYVTNASFAVDVGRYMSPEQARGAELNARSDIYSLGALCFLGLTGRPPYDGADGFAIAYAHVFEPIPRLPADRSHWQPLIDNALAKDPNDRFASIEEFLDALTNVGLERDAALSVALAPAEPVRAASVAPAPPPAAVAPPPPPPPLPPPPPPPPKVAKPARVEAAPGASRSGMRTWPLLVAAAGIALIAAALLLPKGTPPRAPAAAPNVAPNVAPSPAPAGSRASGAMSAAPASSSAESPVAAPPAATVEAPPAQPAAAPAETAAGADAARLSGLDAAEAQADADFLDPAKAPTVVDPLNEALRLGRIDLAG